ncbi:hypothetical protein KSF_029130 [Reticulibacter mediterranei]|uniref:Uncharacterized protein n=1 Tax=Reticulibacter mediterranei TaxID=2778369 RepID=A0A8J3ILE9_9CHLR|nr:hypothetical protein KSF_029130 [Reticulibacter mediterranei]
MNVNIVTFIPEKQHTAVSDREFLYYTTKIRQNQEHTSALSSSSEWRKGAPELRLSAYLLPERMLSQKENNPRCLYAEGVSEYPN